MHIAPEKYPRQHPTTVFTGRMPFLPPNQQCQSTEGNDSSDSASVFGRLLKTFFLLMYTAH